MPRADKFAVARRPPYPRISLHRQVSSQPNAQREGGHTLLNGPLGGLWANDQRHPKLNIVDQDDPGSSSGVSRVHARSSPGRHAKKVDRWRSYGFYHRSCGAAYFGESRRRRTTKTADRSSANPSGLTHNRTLTPGSPASYLAVHSKVRPRISGDEGTALPAV